MPTFFNVHVTFQSGGGATVFTVDPEQDGTVLTMEEYTVLLNNRLTDVNRVLCFKHPTVDGRPGFALVPVRAISSVYVS